MKRGRRRRKRTSSVSGRQAGRQLTRQVREIYHDVAQEEEQTLEHLEKALEELPLEVDDKPPSHPLETDDLEVDEQTRASARRGAVVSLRSGGCEIQVEEGEAEVVDCVLPSRLAHDQRAMLAVGDRASFIPHGDGYRVLEVEERRTELSRPDPQNPRRRRVIAANVDVVVHVASVVRPALRPALIDRAILAGRRGGAGVIVCVNKVDLLRKKKARAELEEALDPYRELDVPLILCSAEQSTGLDALREALVGRTAVFVGHSGVGKSSLLNALAPEEVADTGAVDRRYGRGRHTTTRARLYEVGGIRLIDTPGIREFGLWEMSPEELAEAFPVIDELAAGCRFGDCSHLHEPECAVLTAVEDGELARARWAIYRRILASLDSQ